MSKEKAVAGDPETCPVQNKIKAAFQAAFQF